MREVISYKLFKSTLEFENWQLENPDIKMLSITPIVGSINGDVDTAETEENISVTAEISVVVQYWKSIEEGKE